MLVLSLQMKSLCVRGVAENFVDHWVFHYGPPTDQIAEKGNHFTYKFFLDVCLILRIHNTFTNTYHQRANGEVERFNHTIIASIRAYKSDQPRDCDTYTPTLTYAYKTQPQTSTSTAPFEVVLSELPGPLAALFPSTEYNGPFDFKHK